MMEKALSPPRSGAWSFKVEPGGWLLRSGGCRKECGVGQVGEVGGGPSYGGLCR